MLYEFKHFGLSDYTKICKGENLIFPNHLHLSFELITVLSGQIQVTVDDKIYLMHKNDALLIFPHQLHSISGEGGSHTIHIFSPEIVKAYATEVSGKVPQCNLFSLGESLIDALTELSENASVIEKKGIYYSICAQFDKTAQYVPRKSDDKNLLYKIFKFVEENYSNDCSLRTLSKKTAFSYSYLSRYFKKIVGISFNNYVNQYRLSKVCHLLTNTDYSVLQCAMECGYSSLRSFNRNFSEYLSDTPKDYREKFRKRIL